MTPTDNATLYSLARTSRQSVLTWLETLPHEVFVQESPDVAYGSLRGIYEHLADCYLFWAGSVGLGQDSPELHIGTVADLHAAFDRVDAVVNEFLASGGDWAATFPHTFRDGSTETLSENWLIWHPITHEFHHKGQALAVARRLGYPHPGVPDTDLPMPSGG